MDPKEQQGSGSATAQEPVSATLSSGLLTLVFTDLVGSTAMKQRLGDHAGVQLVQQHHALVREFLRQFPEAQEVSSAGDSFFLVFIKPSDAVRFALLLQSGLRKFNQGRDVPLYDRVGLHLGEVVIEQSASGKRDLHGMQVDTCARVMGLAQPGQILMSRPVFDNARQSMKGEELESVGALTWLNHGRFELKGVDEPLEICEVHSVEVRDIPAPSTSEKAHRAEAPEGEPVVGWRPAVGQLVPKTQWALENKLGEGGFGEVWLGRHQKLKERRVFKFCFRADRVRSLKREMTLFRLIKERMGDHPNIVSLREVYFDLPPYYVEEDYVEGQDLASWCAAQGGTEKVPLETKLEIVAQVADALQAAHDAGVIHRDVKPANILVGKTRSGHVEQKTADSREEHNGAAPATTDSLPLVKLTDFGIGQVISQEALADVTRTGFTQTMFSSSSSHTGTQLYMAPELLAGKPASTRSDIYSLGVVLYQLLAGGFDRPVSTDWAEDVAEPLLREDLQHCFAGDPRNRFAGARDLANNLRTLPERRRRRDENLSLVRRARQRHRAAVISSAITAVLLLVAAALGYGLWQSQRERDLAEAYAYAADMNLAQQALLNDDLGKAQTLLSRYARGSGREHLRGFEWRYLTAEARTDEVALDTSAPESVIRLSISPDGRALVVGRGSGAVELRDPGSLKLISTLETNAGGWPSVAFGAEGNRLLADGPGGALRLWQLNPPKLIGEMACSNRAICLSLSADGRLAAAFHWAGGVSVWNCETLKRVKHFPAFSGMGEHGGEVCFLADARYLAVGDTSGHIRILDWNREQTVIDIAAFKEPLTCLALSPDGSLLASGSGYSPEDIRLWDTKNGLLVGSLSGHRGWITTLQFFDGGSRLASASADQTIKLWDVSSRQLLSTLRGHRDEVWGLSLAGNKTLVSGCKDGALARWDTETTRQRSARVEFYGLNYLPAYVDNSCIAALDEAGAVCLLKPGRAERVRHLADLGTNNVNLAASPGRRLIACGSSEGPVHIWSAESGCLVTNLGRPRRLDRLNRSSGLTFSPGGDSLLVRESPADFTIWNAKDWTIRCSFTENNMVSSCAFSPDGRLLVLGGGGRVVWRNAINGLLLDATVGHRPHAVPGLDFSPDSRLLASVCEDGTLALWDTATRQRIAHWKAFFLGLHGVRFSPDGSRLATSLGGGYAVRLWDVKTRRELISLKAPGNIFYWLGFSPDGGAIVAGSLNGNSYLWLSPSLSELDAIAKAKP